ncbi:hypothetical protein [Falsiroseomonas sp. HW251]|uniref:hypothetical protein n=1 Tax=Falsiroseomonas sp. HW251 TaxID=3390998 RepID=UPI003D31BD1F
MAYRLLQAVAFLSVGCVGLVLLASLAGTMADGDPGLPGLAAWAFVLLAGILVLRQAASLRDDGRPGAASTLLCLVAVPGLLGISAFVALGLLFTAGTQ